MIVACAGHFLIDLPLFGGPAILGIVGLGWIVKVERRRAAETGSSGERRDVAVVDRGR
jgi:hypothetical protein